MHITVLFPFLFSLQVVLVVVLFIADGWKQGTIGKALLRLLVFAACCVIGVLATLRGGMGTVALAPLLLAGLVIYRKLNPPAAPAQPGDKAPDILDNP